MDNAYKKQKHKKKIVISLPKLACDQHLHKMFTPVTESLTHFCYIERINEAIFKKILNLKRLRKVDGVGCVSVWHLPIWLFKKICLLERSSEDFLPQL